MRNTGVERAELTRRVLQSPQMLPIGARGIKGRGFDSQRTNINFPANLTCGTYTENVTINSPCSAQSCVNQVLLVITGTLVTSGMLIAPVSAEVDFYVNGSEVASVPLSTNLPNQSKPISIQTSIMALLQNGTNVFSATVRQSFSAAGCVTGVNGLAVYVEQDYTGTPPAPPTPTAPQWQTYLKYGIIGVAGIAGVFAVLKVVEISRKRG